jgi:hypothetical protein
MTACSCFFPTDKLRQSAGVHSLKAAFDRSGSQRCPGSHSTAYALEVLHAKV